MNFDKLIIREFLKLNPGFTDTPRLIAQRRVGNKYTGAVNFPKTEEAKLTGSKVYSANIPSLNALFRNITPSIEIYKPLTNRDVAKALFEKYGVIAEINEIVDTKISYDPLPLEVTLEAVGDGVTITGSVKVNLTRKVMDLTDIITVVDVESVNDPYPTTNSRFVAIKWAYGNDYTAERETLKAIRLHTGVYGSPDHDKILRLLNDPRWLSPVEWINRHNSWAHPYNVYEPDVPYNGPTSGLPGANQAYTHVMQVNLSSAGGISPGMVLFHYNWRP